MTNIMFNKILVIEYVLCLISLVGCVIGLILYQVKDIVETKEQSDLE